MTAGTGIEGDGGTRLFRLAEAADRLGLRRLVAKAASATYGGRDFSVDREGRWINRQPEATFVSPALHTKPYTAARAWVLDNWAWGYLPKPRDVVIDVGAGVGEEAVVFSHLVGDTGRVISIEAHPRTFSCLAKTVELSALTNVTPLWCALAERDGETLISDGDAHLSNSIVGRSAGVQVAGRSLDSIAGELGLGDIALLKMNIEGAEKLAVGGMAKVAPSIRNVVISCHDFLADFYGGGPEVRTRDFVREALEGQGFKISTRPDAAEPWVRDYLYGSR